VTTACLEPFRTRLKQGHHCYSTVVVNPEALQHCTFWMSHTQFRASNNVLMIIRDTSKMCSSS